MSDGKQIPLFPSPAASPDTSSVKWVRDVLKDDTRRDAETVDHYDPDKFHEGTRPEETT